MMTCDIKIGDKLRDNDPRMRGRVLEVVGFDGKGKAILAHSLVNRKMFETRIALRRIFTDSKQRRSGWSLVNAD